MGPSHGGMCSDGMHQMPSPFGIVDPNQFGREVKVVPADDAVFDEAIAGLGDFLLFLFGMKGSSA